MTPSVQEMITERLTNGARDTSAVFAAPKAASAAVPEDVPTGTRDSAVAPDQTHPVVLATPATAAAATPSADLDCNEVLGGAGAGRDIGEQAHRLRRIVSPSRPPGDRSVSESARVADRRTYYAMLRDQAAWKPARRTRWRTASQPGSPATSQPAQRPGADRSTGRVSSESAPGADGVAS